MGDTGEPEILFEQRGCLGLITLNRPKALNALTYGMITALDAQLDLWAEDESITVVAIQGAGDKAFAAGGDIRALYDAGQGGRTGEQNFRFFADEYRLNTKIKRYPKPYVALMDGIVMGGGVGISVHGSHRIITERTVFAMPETGIGLFPDVGGTYFLPRIEDRFLPGTCDHAGMFAGLTGARFKNADAASVLDAQPLPSSAIDDLIEMLTQGCGFDLFKGSGVPLLSALGAETELDSTDWWVETCHHLNANHPIAEAFGKASVEAILQELDTSGTEWGAKQAEIIRTKSPSSTRIAFRQIRAGANLSFEDCMRLEYRLARYCMTTPDFYEGVRAVILDKDNAPNWSPATLAEASDAHVARAFERLGDEELQLQPAN